MSMDLSVRNRLARFAPIIAWLPKYNADWFRPDLMAGLTLTAFTLPEALAYAELAGLPPQAGLYASIVPPILYTFFGTSRQLVIGPTAAVSVLIAAGLGTMGVSSPAEFMGLAALTACLVGVIAISAYILRLGFLVNFISESVLIGFSTGAGLYIASTQLGKLFGIDGSSGEFFERIFYIALHMGDAHLWAVVLGVLAIAIILVGERYYPRLPWPLIVVLGAIGISRIAITPESGVQLVGHIPDGLPALAMPSLTIPNLSDMLRLAIGVFVLSYVEGMSMARAFAFKRGYHTDSNQELLSLGFVSIGAGLTQGYPVAGSFSRTALNDSAGAKTQLANGFGGCFIALVVVFAADLFSHLPEPVLASVVLVAIRGLVKVSDLRRLFRWRKVEFWTAVGSLVAVLLMGILDGVIVGALLSLLLVIERASESRISFLGKVPNEPQFSDLKENPDNITIPGLHIIRVDEALFYVNAEMIRNKILRTIQDADRPVHSVVLDLEMTSDLDVPGAEMLAELHDELLELGVHLRLSRVQPPSHALLTRTGLIERIGEENIHDRTLFAVAAYLTEESRSGPVACDILPDMVRCVQDMVASRAAEAMGRDRERLDIIQAQLAVILEELEEMACALA